MPSSVGNLPANSSVSQPLEGEMQVCHLIEASSDSSKQDGDSYVDESIASHQQKESTQQAHFNPYKRAQPSIQ